MQSESYDNLKRRKNDEQSEDTQQNKLSKVVSLQSILFAKELKEKSLEETKAKKHDDDDDKDEE